MKYEDIKEKICSKYKSCQECPYSIPIYSEKDEEGNFIRICDVTVD